MANNMISFIANVTKSVGYSTIDTIKASNPTIVSFAEQNAEFGKALYVNVKEYKTTIKNAKRNIKQNTYVAAGINYKNNLFSDLKSGKFYNRERIKKIENDTLNDFLNLDDDEDPFAGFDDDETSFNDDDSSSSDNSDIRAHINAVGEGITNGIAESNIRSAEYIAENDNQNTRKLTDYISIVGSNMTNGFAAINSTMSNVVQFNDKVLKTHVENSAKFYENVTKLDQERNEILKELLQLQKQNSGTNMKKQKASGRTTYEDVVNSEGVPDLREYIKAVKENVKDYTSTVTDMLEALGDGQSNMIHMLTASPLKFVSDGLIKKLVPKVIGESMKAFNDSLSGLFGSVMMKLSDMAENGNGIGSIIGKIFGIKNNLTTNISTNKFNRGPMPWDGESKKTLFNISDQLGKIISLISGNEQRLFDMNTGTYRSKSDITREYDGLLKSSINSSALDFKSEFNDILESIKFNNLELKKSLTESLDDMLEESFKNSKFFNPRKFNVDSAGDYGIYDRDAAKLMEAIFRNMSNGSINSLNAGMMSGRQSHSSKMKRLSEESGIMTAVKNGILDEEDIKYLASNKKKKGGLKSFDIFEAKDNLNHDMFYYLQNMTKELVVIRKFMENGVPKYRTSSNDVKIVDSNGRIINRNRSTNSKATISIDDYRIEDILKDDSIKSSFNGNYIDKNKAFADAEEARNRDNNNLLVAAESILNLNSDDAAARIAEASTGIKQNRKNQEKANKKFTILDKLANANSFGAKIKVFSDQIDELVQKPAKFIASVIGRADQRLFDLLYGTSDDKDPEKRSFVKRLFGGLNEVFGKFNDWFDEHILGKAKEKITKDNIHKAAQKAFNILGIDFDETVEGIKVKIFGKKVNGKRTGGFIGDTLQNVKEDFKIVGKTIGEYFKETKNEIYDTLGLNPRTVRLAGGTAKVSRGKDLSGIVTSARFNKADKNYATDTLNNIINNPNSSEDDIKRAKSALARMEKVKANRNVRYKAMGKNAPKYVSDLTAYAEGTNYVPKTMVATLTEGEMVVPRELNPFYTGKDTSKRQQYLEEKKAADEFFKKYGIRIDGAFADGTDEVTTDGKSKISNRTKEILKANSDGFKGTIEKGFANLVKGLKAANEELEIITGNEEDREKIKENVKKVGNELATNAHAGITGGIIGAGTSLLTGFGGPLLGAAAGAVIGLIKNSTSVQNMLFGTEDKKGLLPESLSKAINKYLPDMTKYGVVGGLASMLPFIPGGPVAGLIVGSSIGFVKNNQEANEALFGKDGVIGDTKELRNKIKKALPNMSVGAIAGLIGGPFGLVSNIMLGSALGYATTTDAFKDAMFGKPDKITGERHGGVLGAFKLTVVDPMKNFVKDGISETKKWFKEKIFKPIAESVAPLKKQIGLFFNNTFGKLYGFLSNTLSKSVGAPLNKFMESKVFKPFTSILKFAIKATTHPIKTGMQIPASIIGGVGNHFRRKQVASGNADYMTASERLQYRKDGRKGLIFKRKLGKDKFSEFDEMLESSSIEDIQDISNQIHALRDFKGASEKERQNSLKTISDSIYNNKNISFNDAKDIMNLVNNGDFKAVGKKIRRLDMSTLDRDSLFNTINDEGSKLMSLDEMSKNSKDTRKELYKQLYARGFKDINDKNLAKYEKLFNKEISARTPELEELKEEEKHNEIVDLFKEAIDQLKQINDPEYRAKVLKESKDRITKENSKKRGLFGLDMGQRNILSDEEINDLATDKNFAGSKEEAQLDDNNYILPLKFLRTKKRQLTDKINDTKLFNAYKRSKRYFEMRHPGEKFKPFYEYVEDLKKSGNENETDEVIEENITEEATTTTTAQDIVNEEVAAAKSDIDNTDSPSISGGKKRRGNRNKAKAKARKNIKSSSVNNGNEEGLDEGNTVNTVIKNEVDKKKTDKPYTTDDEGNVLQLTKDRNGNYEIDKQDSDNKEILKKREEKDKVQTDIRDSISSTGNILKDWWNRLIHPDSEDGEDHRLKNILKLVGKIALGSFGGAVAINMLPVLGKWWTNTAKPSIANWWDERVAPGFARFIYNHQEGIINTSNKLDQLVTNSKNFVLSIPTALHNFWENYLSKYLFGDQEWSVKNILIEKFPKLFSNAVGVFFEKIVPAIGQGVVYAIPTLVESLGNCIRNILNIKIGGSSKPDLDKDLYDANGNPIDVDSATYFGGSTVEEIKKDIFKGTPFANASNLNRGPGGFTKGISGFMGVDAYKLYDSVSGTNSASLDNPEYVRYLEQQRLKEANKKYHAEDGRSKLLITMMANSVQDQLNDIRRNGGIVSSSDGRYVNNVQYMANNNYSYSDDISSNGTESIINDASLMKDLGYDITPLTNARAIESSYNTPISNNYNYGADSSITPLNLTTVDNNYNMDKLYSQYQSVVTPMGGSSYYNPLPKANTGDYINTNYNPYSTSSTASSTANKNNVKFTLQQARNQIFEIPAGKFTLGQIIDNDLPLGIFDNYGNQFTGRDIQYNKKLMYKYNYPIENSLIDRITQDGSIDRMNNNTVGAAIKSATNRSFLFGLAGQKNNTIPYRVFSNLAENGLPMFRNSKRWWAKAFNGTAKMGGKLYKYTSDVANVAGAAINGGISGFKNMMYDGTNPRERFRDAFMEQAQNKADKAAAKAYKKALKEGNSIEYATKLANDVRESYMNKAQSDILKKTAVKEVTKEMTEEAVEEVVEEAITEDSIYSRFVNEAIKRGDVQEDVLQKATGKVVEEVIEPDPKSITGALKSLGKTVINEGGESVDKAIGKKIAAKGVFKGAISKAAEVADKNNIVTKLIDKISDLLKKLLNFGPVKSKIQKLSTSKTAFKISDLVFKIGEKLKDVIEKGGFLSKVLKVGAGLLKKLAVITLVVDAVGGFIHGFDSAAAILGIAVQPSFGVKIVCGLASALNEVFLCGLLPLDKVFDAIYSAFSSFGINLGGEDLEKQRGEAATIVAEYNKKHGTDYNLEDYVVRNTLTGKVKQAAKTVGSFFVGNKADKNKVQDEYDKYIDNSESAQQVKNILNDPLSATNVDIGSLMRLYNREHNTHYTDMQDIYQAVKDNEAYADAMSYTYKQKNSKQNLINRVFRKGGTNTKQYKDSQKIIANYENKYGVSTGKGSGLSLLKNTAYNGNGFISQKLSGISSKRYGNSTIGKAGCGPAVAAMMLNELGYNIPLDKMAQIAEANGYTTKDGTRMNLFTDLLTELGITNSVSSSQNGILNAIASNRAILLGRDSSNKSKLNSPFGNNNHIIMTNGLSADGKYVNVNDPELKSSTKYPVNNIMKGVKTAIAVGAGSKLNTSNAYSRDDDFQSLYELSSSIELLLSNNKMLKTVMGQSLNDIVDNIENIDITKLFDNDYINFKENTPDWFRTAFFTLKNITTLPMIIPALTLSPLNDLYTKFNKMTKETSKLKTSDITIKDALDGKITPFSNDYWKDEIKGNKDNFILDIGRIGNVIKKIIYAPVAMITKYLKEIGDGNLINNLVISLQNIQNASRNAGPVNMLTGLDGKGSGLISQNSPDVAFNKYGNSTLGEAGCAPAVAAMALNDKGGNYSINDTANYALKNNYVNSDGSTNISYFGDIARANGMNASYLNNKTDIIKNISSNPGMVLLGKDSTNRNKFKSPFGPDSHYVLADGIKNGKVIVRDPELNEIRSYNINEISKGLQGAVNFNQGIGNNSIGNLYGSGGRNLIQLATNARVKSKVNNEDIEFTRTMYPAQVARIVNADLGMFNEIPSAKLNEIIRSKTSSGAFLNKGDVFYRASKESGLNPLYVLAHAAHESSWGTSDIAKNKNNYFGIGAIDSNPYNNSKLFSSFEDGIVNGAKWIAANYYNRGQNTLNKMLYNNGSHEYATDSMWDYIIGNIINTMGVDNFTGYTNNPYANSIIGTGSDFTIAGMNNETNDNSANGILSQLSSIFGINGHFAKAFGLSSGSSETSYDYLNGNIIDGISNEYATDGSDIVSTARQYIGITKYVKDGPGNDNMPISSDCSAFVRFVFKKARNVDISRSTASQSTNKNLTTIPHVSDMIPGDLIYFQSGGKITHVGIYCGGDRFIHNSVGKGVTETTLTNYLKTTGLGIKMIRRNYNQGTKYTDVQLKKQAEDKKKEIAKLKEKYNNMINDKANPLRAQYAIYGNINYNVKSDEAYKFANEYENDYNNAVKMGNMKSGIYYRFVTKYAKEIEKEGSVVKYYNKLKKRFDQIKLPLSSKDYKFYYENEEFFKNKTSINKIDTSRMIDPSKIPTSTSKKTTSNASSNKIEDYIKSNIKEQPNTFKSLTDEKSSKQSTTFKSLNGKGSRLNRVDNNLLFMQNKSKPKLQRVDSNSLFKNNTYSGKGTSNTVAKTTNTNYTIKESNNANSIQFMIMVIKLLKSINTNTNSLIKLDKIQELISSISKKSGKGSGMSNNDSKNNSDINNAKLNALELGLKLALNECINNSDMDVDPALDSLMQSLETIVTS